MRAFLTEIGRHLLPPPCARLLRQRARRAFPSLVPPPNRESLHTRTEEELNFRAQGLKEVRDILNGLGISYCIAGGALLGALRDADFIKWDFDVDIETKTEDVRPKRKALIVALEKSGFQIHTDDSSKTDFKVIAVKYGTKYEIAGYLKLGKGRYRRRSFHPDYGEGGEITLRGEKYATFLRPELYLEWFYGDWRTPLRAADNYITDRSRTGPISLTLIEIVSLFKKL